MHFAITLWLKILFVVALYFTATTVASNPRTYHPRLENEAGNSSCDECSYHVNPPPARDVASCFLLTRGQLRQDICSVMWAFPKFPCTVLYDNNPSFLLRSQSFYEVNTTRHDMHKGGEGIYGVGPRPLISNVILKVCSKVIVFLVFQENS
jgi:hypothetical protein